MQGFERSEYVGCDSRQKVLGNGTARQYSKSFVDCERSFDKFYETRTFGDEGKAHQQQYNLQTSFFERQPHADEGQRQRYVGYFVQ